MVNVCIAQRRPPAIVASAGRLARWTALALAACVALPAARPASAQDRTVVETRSGPVRGVVDGDVLGAFGIPYARPPVGELRWAAPVAPDRWTEVRDATKYGAFCPQVKELGDFAAAGANEDCLFLNVFARTGARNRPVMVWIHGGATTGMSDGYDGSAFAREQDVVVVTINYRLGALGALVHPALDGGGATTLYGLRDEQFALQWVRDNIAGFGGDPGRVTLFGESTGATDVLLHMVSPAAQGLFHRAILQSPARYFNPAIPLADAERMGVAFAAAAGCADGSAACLRRLPVEAILAAQGSFGTVCCATLPVVDGHVLTGRIIDAVRSGRFNRVPVLDMTDRDENRWFQAFSEVAGGHVVTADEYPARLQAAFGANAGAVAEAYPLKDFDSPAGALAAATGDNSAICQPRAFNADASSFVRVYAVEFNDPDSPGILPPTSFPLRASHTHEIQYLFPGWKGVHAGPVALLPAQEELAKAMRGIWATFADQGSLPAEFPPVAGGRQPVISLEVPRIRVIDDSAFAHHCGLWDTFRKWTPLP